MNLTHEATGKGRLRHLYLRQAEATGEEMVCVVVNGNGVHKEDILVRLLRERIPGLKSVMINTNRERTNVVLGKKNRVVWGQDYITDRLCDLDFHISPLSFYLSQPHAGRTLVSTGGSLRRFDMDTKRC